MCDDGIVLMILFVVLSCFMIMAGIHLGKFNYPNTDLDINNDICFIEIKPNIYGGGIIKHNKCLVDGLYYSEFVEVERNE